MSIDAEIKGVIPNYYNLIIDKLNKIYEAWDNNNPNLALYRALKLVAFMPRKIKKQIETEKTIIQKKIEKIEKTKGYDYSSTLLSCQIQIRQVANEELENFINKITDLLDQEHLLTQSYGIPTKSRSMHEFQMTVDKAKHDNGE